MGVFEPEIIRSLLNLENQIASPWHHKRIALLWNLLCTSLSGNCTLQGIHPGSSTWSFYIPVSALATMDREHLGVVEGLSEVASEGGSQVWVQEKPQMWPSEVICVGPGTVHPTGLRPKEIWLLDFSQQEMGSPCQTWPGVSPNAVFLAYWDRTLLDFPKP